MKRRIWTHRRLGIGAGQVGEPALAEIEAMLVRVGARREETWLALRDADPVATALLDFACDIDLLAGIAEADATPVAPELLRLERPRARSRGLSWRIMLPAMSGGLSALAVAITLVVTGSTSPTTSPTLSAAAESRQLLSHADTLLTAAADAAPAQRDRLVDEAQADLTHVSRLLPLAPPPARPALRQQLHALNQRMRPLSGTNGTSGSSNSRSSPGDGSQNSTATGDQGAGTTAGTGGVTAPPRRRRPLAGPGDGTGTVATTTGSMTTTGTGTTAGTGTMGEPTSGQPTSGSTATGHRRPPPPPVGADDDGQSGPTASNPPVRPSRR